MEVDELVPAPEPAPLPSGDIKTKMTGAIAAMITVKKAKPTEIKPAPKVDVPTKVSKAVMRLQCLHWMLTGHHGRRLRLAQRGEEEGPGEAAGETERHAAGYAGLQVGEC
jgi:hypothetical protein